MMFKKYVVEKLYYKRKKGSRKDSGNNHDVWKTLILIAGMKIVRFTNKKDVNLIQIEL